MPTARRRKRRSRKRKSSSRRKPSSRKRLRRRVSRPPANTTSSDEDFVLESEGEESSSDSDESLDSCGDEDAEEEVDYDEDDDEDEDAEEEDFSVSARNEGHSSARRAQCGGSRPRKRRYQRHEPDSSDEEFNVDLGRVNSRSARLQNDWTINSIGDDDDDFAVGGVHDRFSHPARANRRRHRRQDSSDEDFDMNLEGMLDNGGRVNEGTVASRPVTRAMDAGQVPDSVQLEGITAKKDLDAPPNDDSKAGAASLSSMGPSARGASGSIDKDTAAIKKKGKEKVSEDEELATSMGMAEHVIPAGNEDGAMAAVVCGICLSETSAVERGKLDCCDHFFCFGCIMEWAKVESRCPMCKQRFTTIAKSGSSVSKRTRTVRIPLRDQVYIPPEEDLPFEDPYADVLCMECQGTGDEGLLLLCDRCDSAAHTFCVGLGRTVPRGDWYCRDCQALVGENSDSENEVEELVLDSSGDEEDEEFLLRSIVASEIQPARQRRVQRAPVSTSRPSSRPRRRMGAGGSRRLWHHRRLSRRRMGNRSVRAAPQLSQSARAFLASVAPEVSPVSEMPPFSGSARTVPQQRRLQERINAMRTNWGRIQTGETQFDAIRAQAGSSVQLAASASRIAAPMSNHTSATDSSVNNRISADSAEASSQGDKDLERAWQLMGQARNLSAGTGSNGAGQVRNHLARPSSNGVGQARNYLAGPSSNGVGQARNHSAGLSSSRVSTTTGHAQNPSAGTSTGIHQQRPVLSHHAPKLSSPQQSLQPSASTSMRTAGALPCSSKNCDRHTDAVSSLTFERSDSGMKRRLKEHQEAQLGCGKESTDTSALTTEIVENRKHDCLYSSSTIDSGALIGCLMDSSQEGRISSRFVENISNAERTATTQDSKSQVGSSGNFERGNSGATHNLAGNAAHKEGASHAKESNVGKSTSSLPNRELKIHLTELVKKQTWPVYIAERLDKEQFKRIARAAVHSLLALFDPSNKSLNLLCDHLEDQGKNVVVNCCHKCLDQHVEDAVKKAKDKIVPRQSPVV